MNHVSTASPTRGAHTRVSKGLFSSSTLMHMSAELVMFGIVIVYFSFTTAKLRSQVARLSNSVESQGKDIEALKSIVLELREQPAPISEDVKEDVKEKLRTSLRKEIEGELRTSLRKEIEEEMRQTQTQAQAQAQAQARAQAQAQAQARAQAQLRQRAQVQVQAPVTRRVVVSRQPPRVVPRRQPAPKIEAVKPTVQPPEEVKENAEVKSEETSEELDGLLKSELAELDEKPVDKID